MRSVLRGACLTWMTNNFRPEGAPTNQPQASLGEQASWSTVSSTGFPMRPTSGTSVVSPMPEITKGTTHIVSKTGTPPKT
jgi:hypothetical protein